MSWRVSAEIVLDVEEADNEEQAKLAAVEQMGDFFRHNTWPDLFKAEKVEDPTNAYALPPRCPLCEAQMDAGIGTSQKNIIDWQDGRWVKDVEDMYDIYQCLNCYEELSVDDLDKLGVPNDVR